MSGVHVGLRRKIVSRRAVWQPLHSAMLSLWFVCQFGHSGLPVTSS